ncbi:hypothetical protein BDN72DRAFT_831394 [Pluteus cervinus]|uniref:Uncharacterized protein n=1 Tax=Pluteus cervinus TaxID=181527 RepID=A0ACD3BE85_9AGAR|nr:hypothetical protein BDN72DRAFT_831394 [Pluteus cervinus]
MATPQTQTTTTSSPLLEIYPYVLSFLKGTFSLCLYFARLVGQFSSFLLHLSPLPFLPGIVLYVIAPVLLVLNAILHLFLWSPFSIVIYWLDVLYPLYAFGGAACIVAGLLAWGGRSVTTLLVTIALASTPSEEKQESKPLPRKSTPEPEVKPILPTPVSKGKEKEVVKERKIRGRRLSTFSRRPRKTVIKDSDSDYEWKTASDS